MGIAGHQANPFQATGHKAAKELEPKFPVFGRAHVQPKNLSFAGRRHTDGEYHRRRHDAPLLPDLQERGVQPDVGVLLAQPPAPEPLDLGIEFLAQARDLRSC
jgi:hypothetical protein